MLSVSKPSLVQKKKQQWAREREEMSQLYLPWGSGERYTNQPQIRNQFASSLELHRQSSYEYQEPAQRQRSPSLPPIHNIDLQRNNEERIERRSKEVLNRNLSSAKRFAFYDEDAEGDTSGYGSETVNHRTGLHEAPKSLNPVIAWQQESKDSRTNQMTGPESWSGRSTRTTTEEGRPRWGDRGVATGRLWEPTEPTARLPEVPNQKKGTPSWVERGLNMIENNADVLIIDQHSSGNSRGFECDRSSCNGSDEGRTFLRGQNVPIEPEIKAQRENQRMKALELQSAILTQLEDREKQRQAERERQLQEEKLEELRIQRQQGEEKRRLEEERRKNEEKKLQEQRKLEALKKALEEAEKKARQEKEKRFKSLKQKLSARSDVSSAVQENVAPEVALPIPLVEPSSPAKSNRTYDVNSAHSERKDTPTQQTTRLNSPRAVAPSNVNLIIQSVSPTALKETQFNLVPIVNGNGELLGSQTNGLQLAVLLPQSLNNSLYSVSLNSLNTINETTETNRLLTPRKYREGKTNDAATQTEPFCLVEKRTVDKLVETDEVGRNIDKNYPSIDENAPQDTNKKDRSFRSEERFKKDLVDRPKWGVNRPIAQYKKQSEKDPFYSQKRKIRQKYRVPAKQYMSQSSEDSRSPSPPIRSNKTLDNKTRNSLSQTYWRNKRSTHELPRNNHASELTSLTATDHSLAGLISANDISDSNKSPTKRITLSQKFINDKYGNRKLWSDDGNERNTKTANMFDLENRKRLIDEINTAKREYLEKNVDQGNIVTKNKF